MQETAWVTAALNILQARRVEVGGSRVIEPQLLFIISACPSSLACWPCPSGHWSHGHVLVWRHLSKKIGFSIPMYFFLIADTFLGRASLLPVWSTLNPIPGKNHYSCYLAETNQCVLSQSQAEGWTLRIDSWACRQAGWWFFWTQFSYYFTYWYITPFL